MGDYSSEMTIEEIGVGEGKKGRILTLTGPGMPHMGAEWGGRTEMTTTWYPGNGTSATQQILGPQELPSSWTGEWHRTLLGRFPQKFSDEFGDEGILIQPHKVRSFLERIWQSGHLLRVTWNTHASGVTGTNASTPDEDDLVIREGRIKTIKFQYTRMHDISWSLEFEWLGRGGPKLVPVSTRDDNNFSDLAGIQVLADQIQSQAAVDSKIKASKRSIPKSASYLTLGQLESFANLPNNLVTGITRSMTRVINQVKRFGDIVAKVKNMPKSVAANALAFTTDTLAITNQFLDEFGRTPYDLLTNKNSLSSVTTTANYFNTINDTVIKLARKSADYKTKFEKTEHAIPLKGSRRDGTKTGAPNQDILKVHVVKEGDTPVRLSVIYYQSPDYGDVIMRANKLPWYQAGLKPGKALIIPKLQNLPKS